jgi:predicted SAM-dependent methyltransferase
MKQATIDRIGAAGRRVPGLAGVLDWRASRLMKRRISGPGPPEVDPVETRAWMAKLDGRRDLRLNVGAGPGAVDGWVNLDLLPGSSDDVMPFDATKRWPFDDASAEAVNSEHFLEHIDPDKAGFYFQEAFRVLRPGGVVRTSTPDLEGLANAFLARDRVAIETHRGHGYEARNHADMFNNYVYSWGHAHIYDFDTIATLLEEAGFEQIERVEFGESRHEVLSGIDTHDVDELSSIVVGVDAVKPG